MSPAVDDACRGCGHTYGDHCRIDFPERLFGEVDVYTECVECGCEEFQEENQR